MKLKRRNTTVVLKRREVVEIPEKDRQVKAFKNVNKGASLPGYNLKTMHPDRAADGKPEAIKAGFVDSVFMRMYKKWEKEQKQRGA